MSLDFSVENMKNYNVLTTLVENVASQGGLTRSWHPVTKALTFATMAVGISRITEDNWKDFYNRLNMWERCAGPMLTRGDNPFHSPDNFLTPLEVYMHIGLGTNASSKTQAQFLKDCFATLVDNEKHRIAKAPDLYLDFALDTMGEEEWQSVWNISDDSKTLQHPFTTDTLVRAMIVKKHQTEENVS